MIEVAKAKNMENVKLVVGDCEKLPFEDNSFDAVICSQSFHHYPNVQDFFDSVFRVLRPGGRLILRDITMKWAITRWLCNNIETPIINLLGHGDVRIYGKMMSKSFATMRGFAWNCLKREDPAECIASQESQNDFLMAKS